MKKLAKLYLDTPSIIERPKQISEILKISYDAACMLKKRFLQLSRNRPLCPDCLTAMIKPDGELVCPKCGYSLIIPELPKYDIKTAFDNMLYGLGSYRLRFGERKGYDRLLQESLDEVKSILEGYNLSEKVLDEAGKLTRKYSELFYDGRATSMIRFKVCLHVLRDLTVLSPQIKTVLSWYLCIGPLHLRPSITPKKLTDALTKQTKSFYPIEKVPTIE